MALSLGQSFIPTPNPSSELPTLIDTQFSDFQRRTGSQRFFQLNPKTEVPDSKFLRVSHSTWDPLPHLPPNDPILTYHEEVHSNLQHSLHNVQRSFFSLARSMHRTPRWLFQTLRELKNNSDIIITDADKNMGLCVISTTDYIAEALRQLSDTSTYRLLSKPPCFDDLRLQLLGIFKSYDRDFKFRNVPSRLIRFCLQDLGLSSSSSRLRLGHFYMLMKVHKPTVVGRPIVSSYDTCSYYVSKYIDFKLQPLLRHLNSYIQSSEHFIHILTTHPVPSQYRQDCVILCADVDSLYPSIPIKEALPLYRESIIVYNNKCNQLLSAKEIDLILDLTHWVLHNNYFTFGTNVYHQIKGTAMGTPCAVVFACFFLDAIERRVLQSTLCPNGPVDFFVIFCRYIDDIFAVFASRKHAELFLELFNNFMKDIIKCSSCTIDLLQGVFLDTLIYRPDSFLEDGLFATSLYQKPQNKYLYIPPFSYHPPSMFSAFIIAELKRYRLLCSRDSDFIHIKQLFKERLLQRGYSSSFLQPLFLIPLDRQSLLQKVHDRFTSPTSDQSMNSSGPLIFKTIGTPQTRLLRISKCIQPSATITSDPSISSLFEVPPTVSVSNPPSIATFFSPSRKSLHNQPLG